jgi:cell division protein FtsZ
MTSPDSRGRAHGANIKVIGVGGGGSNAVNRMMETGLSGVDFIAMNTDRQALEASAAQTRIQLGEVTTRGLGAGGNPDVGKASAEESHIAIKKAVEGADMVFIAAGMGGGTGTGAAPIVAEIARAAGALTVAVVTRPFRFEGARRGKSALRGLDLLLERVDTLIVVPNDQLMNVIDRRTTPLDAFRAADDVLRKGVKGISDIITIPGLINVDFADVRSVMINSGVALMGIGEATGPSRAIEAAQAAVASPLLEASIQGAKSALINMTGGNDLTLAEVHEATELITEAMEVDEPNVIFGVVNDPTMEGRVVITLLATGYDEYPQPFRA